MGMMQNNVVPGLEQSQPVGQNIAVTPGMDFLSEPGYNQVNQYPANNIQQNPVQAQQFQQGFVDPNQAQQQNQFSGPVLGLEQPQINIQNPWNNLSQQQQQLNPNIQQPVQPQNFQQPIQSDPFQQISQPQIYSQTQNQGPDISKYLDKQNQLMEILVNGQNKPDNKQPSFDHTQYSSSELLEMINGSKDEPGKGSKLKEILESVNYHAKNDLEGKYGEMIQTMQNRLDAFTKQSLESKVSQDLFALKQRYGNDPNYQQNMQTMASYLGTDSPFLQFYQDPKNGQGMLESLYQVVSFQNQRSNPQLTQQQLAQQQQIYNQQIQQQKMQAGQLPQTVSQTPNTFANTVPGQQTQQNENLQFLAGLLNAGEGGQHQIIPNVLINR